MSKNFKIVFCTVGLIILQGCSSVKVLDAWRSDDVSSIRDNNFLVVTRTDNQQARIAFENEIVKQMQEKGFNATASFSKFGNFKPTAPKSEENESQLREMIMNEGYDGVVFTVVKDYQEQTRTQSDGGYYAGGNYYGYYPRYYGGFYGYYYNPMAYHSTGVFVPETTTTSVSKLYVLETTIYDLDETGENQLKAVVTTELDNPSSATKTAEEYVKKIVKSLK